MRPEVAERFAFYERRQEAGETIAEYNAVKHKLATHCKFGGFLPQAMRDTFVFGLRDQKLGQQLLGIKDLSYDKAQDLAMVSKAAAKESKEMQSGSTAPQPTVQQIQNRKPQIHPHRVSNEQNVTTVEGSTRLPSASLKRQSVTSVRSEGIWLTCATRNRNRGRGVLTA